MRPAAIRLASNPMAALHWPLPENFEWERLLNDLIWRQRDGDATPNERRMPHQHGD
jgi:hypothetical protein